MGAGTWESHHAITTLMYRYAECVDSAHFEGLSELFAHGTIRSSASAEPEAGMTGEQVGERAHLNEEPAVSAAALLPRRMGAG